MKLTTGQAKSILFIFCFIALPQHSMSQGTGPFQVNDQNPMVIIQGMPTFAEINSGNHRRSLRYILNISNSLNYQTSTNETLFFDYELYHLNFLYQRKLNQHWTFGTTIPFISYKGGFLDGFIENFHETFGFRQGERPNYPRDQIQFYYEKNGRVYFNHIRPSSGLGDIKFRLNKISAKEPNKISGYSLHLKLPTGDSETLTGNNTYNLGLSAYSMKSISPTFHTSIYGGILLLKKGEILPTQHKDIALFANFTLEWKLFSKTSLKIQTDAHTAFYDDTELPLLNESIQLTVGATISANDNTSVDIAIGEDIKVDASPDVNFHFGIRTQY